MSNVRQNFGRWGETQAAHYFIGQGHVIVNRNVRTPYGEIDLIVEDGEVLVFVEVKTRRNTVFGYAEESITDKKMQHMIDSAEFYLQEHPEFSGDWRIDVVAIQKCSHEEPEITHFKNVTI